MKRVNCKATNATSGTTPGTARVGAMVGLPLEWFSREEAIRLRKSLTCTPVVSSVALSYGPPPEPIEQYRVDRDAGVVHVPLCTGLRWLRENRKPWVDERVKGEDLTYPRGPRARDEGQQEFFNALLAGMLLQWTPEGEGGVFAQAPTGSGKTVALLWCIARVGKPALVIVPSVELALQWKQEAMDKLGLEDAQVGIVGGGSKTGWKGKHLVVAVINSAVKQGEEFCKSFGIVGWDEGHRVPANTFSRSLTMFPAAIRVVLSATPERKDGMHVMIHNAVGEVSVASKVRVMPLVYMETNYRDTRAVKWGDLQLSRILTLISKDEVRNGWIGRKAAELVLREGRCVLVLSDRIEQLYRIEQHALRAGVPAEAIGTFAGQQVTGISKQRGRKVVEGGEVSREARKRIKTDEGVRLILATFGSMKEGVDIPRIDAGIEAMPKSTAVQACGRARRYMEGKRTPVWYSIVDTGVPMLKGFASARRKELTRAKNVTFKLIPDIE